MKDPTRTNPERIKEISALKQKIKELEQSESERKKDYEALQESEDYYKAIIQNSSDIVLIVDKLGTITYASPSTERFLGYRPDELIGKRTLDLIVSDDKSRAIADFGRALLTKEILISNVFRIRHKDGTAHTLEGIGKNLLDNPIVEGFVMNVRDITDRKQVEDALRESEERYRTLVENSSDLVYMMDAAGHVTFVNPSGVHVTGYEEEELIGKHYPEFIRPDMRDEAIKVFGRQFVKRIKNTYSEFPILTKEGHEVWLGQNTQLIVENDNVIGFQSVSRDITQRKHAEIVLTQQNDALSILNNFSIDLSMLSAEDNLEAFIAKRIKEIAGATVAIFSEYNPANRTTTTKHIEMEPSLLKNVVSLLGKQVSEIHSVVSDEMYREITTEIIGMRRTLYEASFGAISRPVGAAIQALLKVDRFIGIAYLTEGKLYGTSLLAMSKGRPDPPKNILENFSFLAAVSLRRKRAEEEKRSLEERLQRSEKMESLGTLAGGVAHDLNNVLGVIVGYSEMLLDGVDKSSPLRRGLENVMNGGLRAAAIVEDLLALARRGVQGRSILNLNKIVADCRQSPEFANLSSHHPSVKIITDLEPDLLNISGSAVHLGKSLYNLISNASEAMPKGGTITIRTTNQYLDKPIQGYDQIHTGDYVVLSLSDTGEGISEHDMRRIFEPFYTKKIMGRSGTGLGLAVVWGTVKDHNGYINVQSEEGKGSTFTLYFPVSREEVTAETAAIPTEKYMGKGESILIVDDVKEQRDLAASLLKNMNYNVFSVSSGEEAVAYLKEHEVDLMVLDMIMDPGMDGLDTYKEIREIRPKQKAIIVSGFSESDRVKAAKDLGAGVYVRKPYIKEKLGLAVRKELDRK